ncbi:lysophospholipase [Galbibacter sp. EGI 63066]|uniref:alpha/beta hydrolase n=1 Tax=Galbibacter sp. EGI 63066 TaxID=2993559 RepID=UPI002248B057|nr:alpha/beta hydrolase [Galbibacter sp. EGI 63066]MCX2678739.1 lysophospholipase [Galbibacter sp. EGI 63066]
MEHQGFDFFYRNTKLFGQHWREENPKAVVVLVHGMGEHSGRYTGSLIPELVYAGYAVISFDHFGHGHTEGKRGHCPSYNAVLKTVEMVFEEKEEVYGDLPTFLYGHSMGGNVVLNYAMRYDPNIKGIIATSPLLRMAFDPPKWKMTLGKFFYRTLPFITLPSGVEPKYISRNEKEIIKYKEDPLVHNRISPNYVFPFIKWGEWVISNPKELKHPLLLLHGTGDYITSHWASKAFGKQSDLIDVKLYKGGYHELHNDLDKKDVFETVTNWMDDQLSESKVSEQ